MNEGISELEQAIAGALHAGDLDAAAVRVLRAYGSEILGFLMNELRSNQHAEEVFSTFAEDLWRALPTLELKSTMRAYAYALARNAKHRFLARDLRKQRRGVPLSQVGEIDQIVQATRTGTAPHLRTSNQDKLATLRERLTQDEQALLTLRLDRKLEWREIAEILAPDEEPARAAARLRKRFQLLKDKLMHWAREEGLLPPRDE